MPPPTKVARGQFWTSAAVADFMLGRVAGARTRRVMEAGCGAGAFLAALERAGYTDVVGFEIDPVLAAACRERFGGYDIREGDFLATTRDETFELAVGNPPYVTWRNIEPAVRARLAAEPFWTASANGEWDLLYAMITWQVEKLVEGGELCLIIPVNFINTTHAASFRRYLAEHGNMTSIVSFGEWSPFEDAAPNAIIIRYRKQAPEPGVPVAVVEWLARRGDEAAFLVDAGAALERLAADPSIEEDHGDWRAYTQPAFSGGGTRWTLAPRSARARAAAIEAVATHQLAEVADIGVGFASGLVGAFRLSDADIAAMPPRELREGVITMVSGAACERWSVGRQDLFLRWDHLDSEAELYRFAPWSAVRFESHREALSARYGIAPETWWHWATVRNEPLFARSDGVRRIFVPGIDRATQARYSLGSAGDIPAGDTLGIVLRAACGDEPEYLLAWLCSSHMAAWWAVHGTRTGQRHRFTQRMLGGLPYPSGRADPGLHDEIVATVRDGLAPGTDRTALDAQVDVLFGRRLSAGSRRG